jgi:uncharacterized protein YndB with AHSA1/START domain
VLADEWLAEAKPKAQIAGYLRSRGNFMALSITLIFKATAGQLFAAWTKPEFVEQWLFKDADSESVTADIDLTVGGRFSIVEHTKDGPVHHFGNYSAIDKPHSLSFSLEAPTRFGGVSEVQIQFNQMPEECEMVFRQTGVDAENSEAIWRKMFLNLTWTLIKH